MSRHRKRLEFVWNSSHLEYLNMYEATFITKYHCLRWNIIIHKLQVSGLNIAEQCYYNNVVTMHVGVNCMFYYLFQRVLFT